MATNNEVRENLPENSIVFDNPSFDNSIIGVSLDGNVIYDYDEMVEELMTDDSIDEIEAIDFIEYNIIRSLPYAGEKAPIVVHKEC